MTRAPSVPRVITQLREEAALEPRANGRDRRGWKFTGRSKARPGDVDDVLADLQSHLEWGGRRQFTSFRGTFVTSFEIPLWSGRGFRNRPRMAGERAAHQVAAR
jgi:hypothetical protein